MSLIAKRLESIAPFQVMAINARARALEMQGRTIIHMEIGEPDFPSAEGILRASVLALESGHTHYAPALGLSELRTAIAKSYAPGAQINPERVVITPGASGGLLLVCAALVDPGDDVLVVDPGYPCNRHCVRLFGGHAIAVPVDASTKYQLTAELLQEHWTPQTKAVMMASPSNPTGTVIENSEMERIVRAVKDLGGTLIVDEIYRGLTYGNEQASSLASSNDIFVVNSFSKYYGMTGWRVGWLVAPSLAISALERLSQNMFLATSTSAQHAACAALTPDVDRELRRRKELFRARRDYLLPALRELGFDIPITPEGAFYIYADSSRFSPDSALFVTELLEQAGVAITPGMDFGSYQAERYVRFSYANTIENLQAGVQLIKKYLQQ